MEPMNLLVLPAWWESENPIAIVDIDSGWCIGGLLDPNGDAETPPKIIPSAYAVERRSESNIQAIKVGIEAFALFPGSQGSAPPIVSLDDALDSLPDEDSVEYPRFLLSLFQYSLIGGTTGETPSVLSSIASAPEFSGNQIPRYRISRWADFEIKVHFMIYHAVLQNRVPEYTYFVVTVPLVGTIGTQVTDDLESPFQSTALSTDILREKIRATMFETFNVPGVLLIWREICPLVQTTLNPFLTLSSADFKEHLTGVVLDVGMDRVSVTSFFQGQPIVEASRWTLSFEGHLVGVEALLDRFWGEVMICHSDDLVIQTKYEIFRKVIEGDIQIQQDEEQREEIAMPFHFHPSIISLTPELLQARIDAIIEDCFFKSHKSSSLPNLIFDSLHTAPFPLLPSLLSNIIISGPGSCVLANGEPILECIEEWKPKDLDVSVRVVDPVLGTWNGAKKYGLMCCRKGGVEWVDRETYDDAAPTIVRNYRRYMF